jgi:DNA-binding CsgD family transcriptional regulator
MAGGVMLQRAADSFPAGIVDGSRSGPGCAELLCLLRLHEVALSDPAPLCGLRAMVDEIVRTPSTFRAVVGVPEHEDAELRYLAHNGVPGHRPHVPLRRPPTPMVAKVLETGELVQLVRSDGGPSHACINVPILGADQLLGFLGVAMRVPVPLEPWREHVVWAMADLIALLLLKYQCERSPPRTGKGSDLSALTPRQRDALFELVDRGATNAQIGERLGLSALTVKLHLMAAYRHLGVRARGDAIRRVLTEHADWLRQERQSRRIRPSAD